jgi:hypothetical protein
MGTINSTHAGNVYPFGIEPMYPGMIIGLVIYFVGYSQRSGLRVESE